MTGPPVFPLHYNVTESGCKRESGMELVVSYSEEALGRASKKALVYKTRGSQRSLDTLWLTSWYLMMNPTMETYTENLIILGMPAESGEK